jgi:hypothetical protein
VHKRGATIKALDRQFLDLSTTIGKGILAFLAALAQDEREIEGRLKRTRSPAKCSCGRTDTRMSRDQRAEHVGLRRRNGALRPPWQKAHSTQLTTRPRAECRWKSEAFARLGLRF